MKLHHAETSLELAALPTPGPISLASDVHTAACLTPIGSLAVPSQPGVRATTCTHHAAGKPASLAGDMSSSEGVEALQLERDLNATTQEGDVQLRRSSRLEAGMGPCWNQLRR